MSRFNGSVLRRFAAALMVITALAAIGLSGCAARMPYLVHPGAVNEVDSRAYDGLLFTKGVLRKADQDPPTQSAVISMVASLRRAHVIAYTDWTLYRAAFLAGQPIGELESNLKSSTKKMNSLASSPSLASFRVDDSGPVLDPLEGK